MKQVLWLKQPGRQAFGVMARQKSAQHLAVWLKPVSPEILTHQLSRRAQLLLNKGQRHLGGRCIGKLAERDLLGTLESLKDCNRQPRMLVDQRAADAERKIG